MNLVVFLLIQEKESAVVAANSSRPHVQQVLQVT